jgi:uncharacterized membrane protein YkoI
MKKALFLTTLIGLGLLAGPIYSIKAADKDKSEKSEKPELKSRAKIGKKEAKNIALGKVPKGKVKEQELEEENGKLIWSLDIKTKGSSEITEVHVDAITGEVLSVQKETAAAEKNEKKEEKKKKESAQEKK